MKIVIGAAALSVIVSGSAFGQVAIPALTVLDATRCAAAAEMISTLGASSNGVANSQTDAYLIEHPQSPAMDLIYSPSLSQQASDAYKRPEFVYTTKHSGLNSACLFEFSDDGRRHYLMNAWLVVTFTLPPKLR